MPCQSQNWRLNGKCNFQCTPVTLVAEMWGLYLLGVINVDDQVSSSFSLGSGTSTKVTFALSMQRSPESSWLDSAAALSRDGSVRGYLAFLQPRKQTQKTPLLIHAKKGKEKLVLQSTSTYLQGIPGFPRGWSPLEDLRGAGGSFAVGSDGLSLGTGVSHNWWGVSVSCWDAQVPRWFDESKIISLQVLHTENIHKILSRLPNPFVLFIKMKKLPHWSDGRH